MPLLRKQTADFAGHRARYGLPVTYEEIAAPITSASWTRWHRPQGRIATSIWQLFERTN